MREVSKEYIYGAFAAMGVTEEIADKMMRNITSGGGISNKHLQAWYKVKELLKIEGYTHLPNGDDL